VAIVAAWLHRAPRRAGGLTSLALALLLPVPGHATTLWPEAVLQDTVRQDTVPRVKEPPQRDPIGDLNAGAVQAGEFAGAILLPGTRISLAIGGFIKTVVISDSRLEVSGADLLAASIGTVRADQDGNYSVDATLSRLYFDGRARVPHGLVRGYIEWDFNAANNGSLGLRPRLLFGSWRTKMGTLLAGHNWTTFMNPAIIPEGLTEATVSGAVFARQAQIRWTQVVSARFSAELALENPGAGDFLYQNESVARTRWPDVAAALAWNPFGAVKLRATGVLRRIANGASDSLPAATGGGGSVSGVVQIGSRDRMVFSGTYGKGIGRYVLGLGSGSSGVVDAGSFKLLRNQGGIIGYRHDWGKTTRSSAAAGHARVTNLGSHPPDAFRSSTYGFVNFMWSTQPYLTLGVEYAYGRNESKDHTYHDNHRLALGVQMF